MSLNPYDILGIEEGSDKNKVKIAYKNMLMKTHPDKMNGNAKYFMLVHEAYESIMKSFERTTNFNHAPKKKVVYQDVNVKPMKHIESENMNSTKFNQFFENNRIDEPSPFNRGYSKYMGDSLKYQEDIDIMKQKSIEKKKREIVIYKEPEPINELYTGNYCLLGKDRIIDFSCSNGGTDYMKAYMDPEKHIDTCKKYKNVDHLKKQREVQDFTLSEEEKINLAKKEKKLRKLEQYRINNIEKGNQQINERYTALNNLLV